MTYFRGTLYFNVFSKTRYIVNLLFEVFGDMIPFLTIFAFSTVSFCIIINAFAGENDQRSFFS